jgi:hypothetical protein
MDTSSDFMAKSEVGRGEIYMYEALFPTILSFLRNAIIFQTHRQVKTLLSTYLMLRTV